MNTNKKVENINLDTQKHMEEYFIKGFGTIGVLGVSIIEGFAIVGEELLDTGASIENKKRTR